ncbi:MAG: hypothetical protein IJM20_05280 [Clostridia bacterium]|jgi:hypothetical protein|nr:hypothetical protein [Clostridia bacterium]
MKRRRPVHSLAPQERLHFGAARMIEKHPYQAAPNAGGLFLFERRGGCGERSQKATALSMRLTQNIQSFSA